MIITIRKKFTISLVLLFSVAIANIGAQNSDEPSRVTSTYFIENGSIITRPGNLMKGSVLIEDGLIKDLGPSLQAPYNAEVIKGDSLFIYAGFIDGFSHTGIPKEEEERRPDVKDPGNPPNDIAGITPQNMAADIFSASEKSIESLREIGFVISHTAPRGRMLPGKTALISLGSGQESDLIINREAGLFSQFRSARGVYPATIIAIMAKWRDLYRNAKLASEYEKSYRLNSTGLTRPSTEKELSALFPVVNEKQTVYFLTEEVLDIHRALTLKKELDLNMVLVDVKQGFPVLDQLQELNIPVILSLNLPDEIEEKKDSLADVEVTAMKEKKRKAVEDYVSQGAQFANKGIPFAFSTASLKPKDFKKNLMRIMEAGLTEDQALAALTTNPAKMLGLSEVAGTITKGKPANLIITDKPFFEEKSSIRYVFVDGNKFEQEAKANKKKSADGEKINPAGDWSYEADIPGDPQTGKMIIEKNNEEYTIYIISSAQPDDRERATDVSVDGSSVTFNLIVQNEGMTLDLYFDLSFEAATFTGTVSVGEFGAFPISGDLLSDPK